MQTIEISEELYQRLQEQAVRLNLSPAQLIERLVSGVSEPDAAFDAGQPVPPAGSPAALAAVERLAGLFADLTLPDLEATLSDPLLALANVDLDDLPQ